MISSTRKKNEDKFQNMSCLAVGFHLNSRKKRGAATFQNCQLYDAYMFRNYITLAIFNHMDSLRSWHGFATFFFF